MLTETCALVPKQQQAQEALNQDSRLATYSTPHLHHVLLFYGTTTAETTSLQPELWRPSLALQAHEALDLDRFLRWAVRCQVGGVSRQLHAPALACGCLTPCQAPTLPAPFEACPAWQAAQNTPAGALPTLLSFSSH